MGCSTLLTPRGHPDSSLLLIYMFRRFVFAPVCRGVTSKRSGDSNYIQNDKPLDDKKYNILEDGNLRGEGRYQDDSQR